MQKLRDLYKETQRNANENFEKVTQDRMKKILAFANKEYESMLNKNDFTYLDQIVFYRDKFQELVNTINISIEQGYKKPRVQAEFIAILKDNFALFNAPQEQNNEEVRAESKVFQVLEAPPPPKEVIQSYFENKKQEIQRSKIGFKSVIDGIPYVPKKFAVKPSEPKKVMGSIVIPSTFKDAEVKALKDQIERLKKELADKDGQKQFRIGLLQIEKKEYEDRIRELGKELEVIQTQNAVLKEQSAKGYPINHPDPYYYIPATATAAQQEIKEQEYNPYQIRFRDNDINKIKNKVSPKQVVNTKYLDHIPQKSLKNFMKEQQMEYEKKGSDNFEIMNQLDINDDQIKRKSSFSVLNASNVSGSQVSSIALKSKVSFFKNSMVIHKGEDYEVAVKSVDIVHLEKKRISIYINNKERNQQTVNFEYKFDPNYYELNVAKKLASVDGYNQGKEQVEVRLINSIDLDSLIEVQMTINARVIIFLLPALFIQFIEKRPQFNQDGKYKTQRINPVHQFSSLHSAEQVLPIEKLYGNHQHAGRLFAASKYHQGYIYFRWVGGQVEIKTIAPWKLLFGYLFLKDY